MDKQFILFDLDGTVTDPKEGITKSVKYSLETFDIHIDCLDDLIPFIGPPLRDSYIKFYNFSEPDAEKAVAKYREYFSDKGIFENTLYPGMDKLLHKLQQHGKTLIIATSKPAVFAERILKYFNIDTCFSFIAGSELDGRRSRKSEVINYAIQNVGINDLNKAIMIGDREHDIIGARETGIDSIGVLYGYGSLRELTEAGANYIAENVNSLSELLISVG